MTHPADSPTPPALAPWIIAGTFALGSLAYSLHAASFLHPKAAVFAVGCVALAGIALRSPAASPWAGFKALLPLWLILLFGVLQAALGMAPVPVRTGEALLLLTPALLFATLAYPHLSYARVQPTLLLGSTLVAAMGVGQYWGWLDALLPPFPTYTQAMYSVFGNQDLIGGFVAIGLVVALQGALRGGPVTGISLAALAVLLPAWLLAGSRSAWLAGAAGIAIALLGMGRPSPRRQAALVAGLLAGLVLIALLSPMTTIERVTGTFAADDEGGWLRLWFWDGTLRMLVSKPLFGTGLGHFAWESPRFLGEAFMHTDFLRHKTTELAVLHAHSDPLEYWAELGAVGLALLIWMAARVLRAHAAAMAPLAALFVFACFNSTVASPPHAVAGLLLMGCLLREDGRIEARTAPRVGVAPLAGSVALLLAVVLFLLIPSVRLRTAQTAHLEDRGTPARYEAAARHSVLWPEVYASLAQWHVDAEDWEAAIVAYERALEGLDTGRAHLELGALYHRTGNATRAERHLRSATQRWPWNYDAWRLFIATQPVVTHAEWVAQARAWLAAEDGERLSVLFTARE